MTKRYTVWAIGLALLVVLAGVALSSCTTGTSEQSVQQVLPQTEPTPEADDMERMFPGLEGIPKEELFDHFLSGQFALTDRNGTPFTLKLTPGTVSTVSTTTITLTPNGETTTQTFNITPDTIVRAMPSPGSVEAIVPGDKVVVFTRDTSLDAVLIAKHGPLFHRRMMNSMME